MKTKAITICQPYAHLICLPETDQRHKRVENRSWPTRYRGRILIHAGKSKDWLMTDEFEDEMLGVDLEYKIPIPEMAFGAVVATATLADCLHITAILAGDYSDKYPWLAQHQHTAGQWCWVLSNVAPLPKPIQARGAQGLWEMEWPL